MVALTLRTLVVLVAFSPTGAIAQPVSAPSRVLVVPPQCAVDGVDVVEATRLFRIELVGDAVEQVDVVTDPPGDIADESDPGRIAIVHLRVAPCAADATAVEAIIDDAVTRKRVRRSIELGGVPLEVRSRALALGIAELLRASWAELARIDALDPAVPLTEETRSWLVAQALAHVRPAEPPEEPVALTLPSRGSPSDHPSESAVPPSPRSVGASLGATLRAFPADGSALLGARLGLSLLLVERPALRLRVDASYERGRVRVDLGDIALSLAAVGLAIDVSTEPSAPLVVELGPRIEAGHGTASGTPADPGDVGLEGSGLVTVLSVHVLVSATLADSFAAFADVALGHTLGGLDATVDGRSTSGLAGPLLVLTIGLRFAP